MNMHIDLSRYKYSKKEARELEKLINFGKNNTGIS